MYVPMRPEAIALIMNLSTAMSFMRNTLTILW